MRKGFVYDKVIKYINKNFKCESDIEKIEDIKKLLTFLDENNITLDEKTMSDLVENSHRLRSVLDYINTNMCELFMSNDTVVSLLTIYTSYLDKEEYGTEEAPINVFYEKGKKSHDMDLTKTYFDSLPPALAPEESIEYAKMAAHGDEAAKQKLIEGNLKLVISIAKCYINQACNASISFLDLIQDGNMGLLRAAEKFDYNEGCRFSTYATFWINQSIRRALADTSRTIRIPIHKYESIRKMNAVKSRLFNELQRMPTDIELAQALEITVDKLHYLQNIEIDAVSLSTPINDKDNDSDELGDFIEDKSANVEEEIVKKEYLESFKNAVLESEILDQREKEIICLRYGINCDRAHSLEEIGQKMGVTRERIRQLENKSLRKLERDKNIKKYNSDYNPKKITASYVKNIQPIKQPEPVKKEAPVLRRRYSSYYSL